MMTKRTLLIAAGVMMAAWLLTCSRPTAPDLHNPYDEEGEGFIPTADLQTTEVTGIRALQAESGGQFETDYGKPVTAKGVCWSTEETPTLEDDCTNDGQGHDAFTSVMSGLEPDQTYFVRAYATNEAGTIYGGQRIFTTRDGNPVLSTTAPYEITAFSAKTGGNIFDDGVAEITGRGVCYVEGWGQPGLSDSCVEAGSGMGSFEVLLEDLSPDQRYTVRAYATNNQGTSYGEQRSFTTLQEWPRDNQTAVVDVTSTTGRVWMDRNLGASRAATSSTDSQAYGDLYQWGRAADGHQKRNSSTTSTRSSTDQPSHGSFILTPNSPYDWRIPQNNNLWQGINGVNNPCPAGYRLPTEAEWNAERVSWSSNNTSGAFGSPLKLPMAGYRSYSSGWLFNVGSDGRYWSGTVSGSLARDLSVNSSNAGMRSNDRARGYAVRCTKD